MKDQFSLQYQLQRNRRAAEELKKTAWIGAA